MRVGEGRVAGAALRQTHVGIISIEVLHLCLAHLPHTLEDDLFRAPTIIEDGYTAEEIEFSILE